MEAKIPTGVKTVAIAALSRSGWGRWPGYVPMGADAVWCINNAHASYHIKPDLIVAMDSLQRDVKLHPQYVREITTAGVPVLSSVVSPKWPAVKLYPLNAVIKKIGLGQFARHVLDNTVNYTIALAIAAGVKEIRLYGCDFGHGYEKKDLAMSLYAFKLDGYHNPPDWFKYYNRIIQPARAFGEPGGESQHFLLGIAHQRGIKIVLADDATTLNNDRDRFFYGYQHQPRL